MKLTFWLLCGIIQGGVESAFLATYLAYYGGIYWLFYVPIFALRAFLWAFASIHGGQTTSFFHTFSYKKTKGTALYLQASVCQIFVMPV